MADLSDVETALVNIVSAIVYPNGTGNPSIVGADVRIYPGWPLPANLDRDLAAGKTNIAIFPTAMERVTTRFSTDWQDSIIPSATLTLNVANNTVTVGGTVTVPQTCMVILNNVGYAYAVKNNDTLNTIATAIAALISGASATNNVVTLTGVHSLTATIGVTGTALKEVKRQARVFMIAIFAPSPTLRAALGSAIDPALANTERFVLPDNTYARLIYRNTREFDNIEKAALFRRDLDYEVEYATTITESDYTIADSYLASLASGQTGNINP